MHKVEKENQQWGLSSELMGQNWSKSIQKVEQVRSKNGISPLPHCQYLDTFIFLTK